MNILLLAPHPFYQERGTPIAVDLLLRVLSQRGNTIDVLTYHEGAPRAYPGVTLHRIPDIAGIRNIRPGFSWKKVICDLVLMFKAFRLAGGRKYQVVHAVEESVFIAMLLRLVYRLPYIFDMDSSMPLQMIEKAPRLKAVLPALGYFESLAIRHALAVVVVCDALEKIAMAGHARRVFVLRDISMLSPEILPPGPAKNEPLEVERPCLMYIGNLEKYQGIDLMLESFAILLKSIPTACLAIIGGHENAIRQYQQQSALLGIAPQVRFFGPRPLAGQVNLFKYADVLVSPRITGTNTPMKIYSYLQSGKPILATDLPTHTQVLDASTAVLAAANPEDFSAGMLLLLRDPALGSSLAERASKMAEERFGYKVFTETLERIYLQVESDLRAGD